MANLQRLMWFLFGFALVALPSFAFAQQYTQPTHKWVRSGQNPLVYYDSPQEACAASPKPNFWQGNYTSTVLNYRPGDNGTYLNAGTPRQVGYCRTATETTGLINVQVTGYCPLNTYGESGPKCRIECPSGTVWNEAQRQCAEPVVCEPGPYNEKPNGTFIQSFTYCGADLCQKKADWYSVEGGASAQLFNTGNACQTPEDPPEPDTPETCPEGQTGGYVGDAWVCLPDEPDECPPGYVLGPTGNCVENTGPTDPDNPDDPDNPPDPDNPDPDDPGGGGGGGGGDSDPNDPTDPTDPGGGGGGGGGGDSDPNDPTDPTDPTDPGGGGGGGGSDPNEPTDPTDPTDPDDPGGGGGGGGDDPGPTDPDPEPEPTCDPATDPNQCQEPGSSWGGECGTFTCEGDAVQCAIAREIHRQGCELKATEDTIAHGNKVLSGELDNQDNAPTGSREKPYQLDLSDTLDYVQPGSYTCPGDLQFQVLDVTVTLTISKLCPYLEIMGQALMVAASLIAIAIIRGAF